MISCVYVVREKEKNIYKEMINQAKPKNVPFNINAFISGNNFLN